MLAIQENFVRWEKNSRSAQGAVERRSCFLPHTIDEGVDLSGSGIFVCKNIYYQYDKIYTPSELRKNHKKLDPHLSNPPIDEGHEHRMLALDMQETHRKGRFCDSVSEIDVDCIDIIEEGEKYIIKWFSFDYWGYKPVRSGYNEDFHRRGAKAQGKRIMCETAFILDRNESGRVEFNYRCADYYGQHYVQYCIYFINIDKLERDSFLNVGYEHKYSRMADLF